MGGGRFIVRSIGHNEVCEREKHKALWELIGGPCISAQRSTEGKEVGNYSGKFSKRK